jgi:hypothetical protein
MTVSSANNPQSPTSIRSMLLQTGVKLILPVVLLEIAFLTFPATPWSSTMVQLVHGYTLFQIQPLNLMMIHHVEDKKVPHHDPNKDDMENDISNEKRKTV